MPTLQSTSLKPEFFVTRTNDDSNTTEITVGPPQSITQDNVNPSHEIRSLISISGPFAKPAIWTKVPQSLRSEQQVNVVHRLSVEKSMQAISILSCRARLLLFSFYIPEKIPISPYWDKFCLFHLFLFKKSCTLPASVTNFAQNRRTTRIPRDSYTFLYYDHYGTALVRVNLL